MLERLVEFFIGRPHRMVVLGGGFVQIGGLLIVAGLVAQVATKGASVARDFGSQRRPDVALAELLPTLPTWWVPEAFIGFLAAASLMAAGFWLRHAGHQYERIWRS